MDNNNNDNNNKEIIDVETTEKKEEVNNNQTTNDNLKSQYDNKANISLILGILSILFLAIPVVNLVLAIIAIVQGKKIPKEYRDGKASAGIVMGIIVVVLSIIGVILILILTLGLGAMIFYAASEYVNDYEDNYTSYHNELNSNYNWNSTVIYDDNYYEFDYNDLNDEIDILDDKLELNTNME